MKYHKDIGQIILKRIIIYLLRFVQIKGIVYTFLIKSFHTSKSNNIKRLNKEERTRFKLAFKTSFNWKSAWRYLYAKIF